MKIGIDTAGHGNLLRTMHANKGTWKWSNDPNYAYRTILPNETTFDLGDDVVEIVDGLEVRVEQTWEEIVDQSEALWDELDDIIQDGQYLAALSGGKGTHTQLFLEDPTDGDMWDGKDWHTHDLRSKIADVVRFRRLAKGASPIKFDPVCVAPSHGGRQLREFGAVKKRTKTLFFVGPHERKPLPRDQAEAYAQAGIRYPPSIVRCRSVDGLQHARLRKALGKKCPATPACLLQRGGCDACPY